MSEFCTRVKLDGKEVARQLLKSDSVKNVVEEIANSVAHNYGENAEVRMSYQGRVTAFINAPYAEASEDNKLLKAVHK